MGGIVGGVIALVAVGLLQWTGVLPSPGGGADLAAMRSEIGSLSSQVATLQSGASNASSPAVGELQTRVDKLTTDMADLRSALERGAGGETAGLATLDTKIAEIERQIAQLAENPSAGQVDFGPLDQRIATLERAVKAAEDTASAGDARIAALEQNVASLSAKLDAQASQPKIALSIAAASLRSAVDGGKSFSAELETLAAIAPNLPQLPALRAQADKGVATREDLLSGMNAAAEAIITAGTPANPDAGLLDQLMQSASSLVTVRPVGAVPGEGVPETVARMEAALKAGDLAKALAEYETLPEAAKAAGVEFAGRLKARADVETLVGQAIAEAMKTV